MAIRYKDDRQVKVIKKGGKTPFIIRHQGREVKRIRFPVDGERITSDIVYETPSINLVNQETKRHTSELVDGGDESESVAKFTADIEVSSRHWFLRNDTYLKGERFANRVRFGLYLHPADKTQLHARYYLGKHDWEQIIPIEGGGEADAGGGGNFDIVLDKGIDCPTYYHLLPEETKFNQLDERLQTLNQTHGIDISKRALRELKFNLDESTIELGPALFYLDNKVNNEWRISARVEEWSGAFTKRLLRNHVSTPVLNASLRLLPEWDGSDAEAYKKTHHDFHFDAYPDADEKVWKLRLADGSIVTISESASQYFTSEYLTILPRVILTTPIWEDGGAHRVFVERNQAGQHVLTNLNQIGGLSFFNVPTSPDRLSEVKEGYHPQNGQHFIKIKGLLNGKKPTPFSWVWVNDSRSRGYLTNQPNQDSKALKYHESPSEVNFSYNAQGNTTFYFPNAVNTPFALNWMLDPALYYGWSLDMWSGVLYILPGSRAAGAFGLSDINSFKDKFYTIIFEYYEQTSQTNIAKNIVTFRIEPLFLPTGYTEATLYNEDGPEGYHYADVNRGYSYFAKYETSQVDTPHEDITVSSMRFDEQVKEINLRWGVIEPLFLERITQVMGKSIDAFNQNVTKPVSVSDDSPWLTETWSSARSKLTSSQPLPTNPSSSNEGYDYGEFMQRTVVLHRGRNDQTIGRWGDWSLLFLGKELQHVNRVTLPGKGVCDLNQNSENGLWLINQPDSEGNIWVLFRAGMRYHRDFDQSGNNFITNYGFSYGWAEILLEYNVNTYKWTGRYIQPATALLKFNRSPSAMHYLIRHLSLEMRYGLTIGGPSANKTTEISPLFRNGLPETIECIGTYYNAVPYLSSEKTGILYYQDRQVVNPLSPAYRNTYHIERSSTTFSLEHAVVNFNICFLDPDKTIKTDLSAAIYEAGDMIGLSIL